MVCGRDHVHASLISPEVLGLPLQLNLFTSEGKAEWTRAFQNLTAAIDSSAICLFSSFALGADEYAARIHGRTGIDMTADGWVHLGERIWSVQPVFNLQDRALAGHGWEPLFEANEYLLKNDLLCSALDVHVVENLTGLSEMEWDSYRLMVHPSEEDQYIYQH